MVKKKAKKAVKKVAKKRKKRAIPLKFARKATSRTVKTRSKTPRRPKVEAKARVKREKRVKTETVWSLEDIIKKVAQGVEPQEERRIEEAKFDIGVPSNGAAKPSYDIPYEYNVNRAVILTVDPRFVFTYWEVRQESMHEAISHLGPSAKLTLRFYDISATKDPDKSPFWDIEVFDRLGNWYLRLDYPEQILVLDVGMKNESGSFHSIVRSNVIRLPRQALAAPGPLKWMIVSPDGEKIISDIEEYTDADLELLKKILGPYFFDLLMRGQFASISGSSVEAIFQDIAAFRMPMEISSSPTIWKKDI